MKQKIIKKPAMKKELSVRDWNERYRWIAIDSTTDAIVDYAEYGTLRRYASWDERPSDSYTLFVDARFDFHEVLEWIKAHGEEAP